MPLCSHGDYTTDSPLRVEKLDQLLKRFIICLSQQNQAQPNFTLCSMQTLHILQICASAN